MSSFSKRAGKLLGNIMREYVEKPNSRSQEQGQENMNTDHPTGYTHSQPQQRSGSGFFQQPFIAPLLEDPPEEPQRPAGASSNNFLLEALKLPDEYNNTVPDFSRVGYREGHVLIPVVPDRVIVEPSANQGEDDTARIQAAIDQVSGLPLAPLGEGGAMVRGAVLLKAGVYRVAGALVLHSSGVVLRGEGQSETGTIVVATGAIQRDFILVNGMLKPEMGSVDIQTSKARTKEMMPTNGYKSSKRPATYTRAGVYIPVGETFLPVESTTGYNVGDRIVVERPGSDEWIRDIGMDQLPPRPGSEASVQWKKDTFTFRFERTIVGVDPNLGILEVDIPLVMSLDPKYPPAKIYELIHKAPMISDVGVENLRLLSECDPADPEDEKHAWYAIVLDNVCNGWVAHVTTMLFVSGIFASTWSRFITIQDSSVLYPVSKPKEGGRRYMFNLSGQMGLVKRCFTNNARHDFITLGRVCGPNVFVDSTGVDANNDTGPHERWAMGTLYDNITCNTINVRQRLWKGTGQGWSGAYQVVYNCTAKSDSSCFQDAPGTTNWIIGFSGGQTAKPEFSAQSTKVLSANAPVEPRSLYWAQLSARLGGAAVQICETEADTAIAKDCQPADIVLSQDSDFFAYESVKLLWRPVGQRHDVKVLEYDKAAILSTIGLSSTQLTALACVSCNDYNKNIRYLGIATNYGIIKKLPDGAVPSLVEEYLSSPEVVLRDQDEVDFTASILVFTSMTQEVAVQSEAPLMDSALPMSFEVLYQKYKSIKDQNAKIKAEKRANSNSTSETRPQRQGKNKEFRRHRVIDRPAHQPGLSQQVHRPRYSYKVRPEPLKQEPPPISKQYQWKPYTAQQEAQSKKAAAESMRKQAEKEQRREARRRRRERELLKKPPPRIELMNKMQLVKAMAWEHPLVSLPVGTLKANTKRAAAAAAAAAATTSTTHNQPMSFKRQQQYQLQQHQEVSACVMDVVQQTRVTKRQAQEFLGEFIETVFKHGPTEEDREILSTLCPAVKSKICVSPKPSQGDQSSSNSSVSTLSEGDSHTDAEDESMETAETESTESRDSAEDESMESTEDESMESAGEESMESAGEESMDSAEDYISEDLVDQDSTNENSVDEDAVSEDFLDEEDVYEEIVGENDVDEEEDDGNDVDEDDDDEDDEPSAVDQPFIAFYQILLGHIYSRKIKSKTVAERQVGQLIARATSLGITLPPAPQRNVSYPVVPLLESTTKQVYRSMKLMYRNGSVTMEEKASGGSRRIAPLSSLAAQYVDFSERQLLPLLWAWPTLKVKIQSMMIQDHYFQDPTIVPAQADAIDWLARTTPGRLVTTFLSDVGLPPNKHDKGFRKATTIMDLEGKDGREGLRKHVGRLRAETFDPKEWQGKGYILRGSIRTDGRLLHLLAFKNKELQSVRFRRLSNDKLPNPLITTIGGTDGISRRRATYSLQLRMLRICSV
ncbi:unnamed protein product [Mortierella alpina]